jgi:hypothetical protein
MHITDIVPTVVLAERIRRPDDEVVTITFTPRGDAKERVIAMLSLMVKLGGWGCSRTLGVLDDKGFETIDFDGDGADKILDLKVNGQKVE